MARQQPEQRQPPAAWLRLRYTKLGPARFTSARDVARLIERAIKRAGVPVAYSSGFSPHQRVSYAFPAPTGAASWAEYVLVGLTIMGDAQALAAALNAELPSGVRIEAADMTTQRHLPAQLEASTWRIDWPGAPMGQTDVLRDAVQAFMAAKTVMIDRRAKSQTSQQDVRGAVVRMDVEADALTVVLRQTEPLIRPTDVLDGLATWLPGLPSWGRGMLTRQAQGVILAGAVTNLG